MCQRLPQLREAMAAYASGFDPALWTTDAAEQVVAEAAAIEAMAGTVKALAAARAAEGGRWQETGHRSPADALSRQTGTSRGAAKEALDLGRRLRTQPDLAAEARSGQLSSLQTALIADAAEADPGCTNRLIEEAKRSSVADLRDEVGRVKAAAHPDLEARHAAIKARRRLRAWTDTEGVWRLTACGSPAEGAQVMAALRPGADGIFRQARAEGRREPAEAYAFDALVALATRYTSAETDDLDDVEESPPGQQVPALAARDDPDPRPVDPGEQVESPWSPPATPGAQAAPPSGGAARGPRRRRKRRGAPVKLLVRIDYDTFLRGVAAPGETCELVGYGPVPVSVVRDLTERGDPFVAAILTRGRALVGVAHLGRQPTAPQQSALEWLYPSCAAEGCPAQAHLQRDHRADWADTHFTMLDLLDLLCSHHHALKTRRGWALVAGRGKRAFVSPDDPRHPRHHLTEGPSAA